MLSKLHGILERVLDLPDLHTAALLTVTGQLISYASDPNQSKDYVRVIVGIAMETWKETRGERFGMVETEVSLIPQSSGVEEEPFDVLRRPLGSRDAPTDSGRSLAEWLSCPLRMTQMKTQAPNTLRRDSR